MSYTNPMSEREYALEEVFFRKRNAELIASLRALREREHDRDELRQVLGVRQSSLLDSLLDAGITPHQATALWLLPVVSVAWADGRMGELERRAVLEVAHERGVDRDGGASGVLSGWLEKAPGRDLFAAWEACLLDICRGLEARERSKLVAQIIEEARHAASAASVRLGLGKVVSREVKQELERLTSVLGA